MKLTKKLETEILKAYNAYWDNYLKGNVEAMDVLLAEEYTQVGSAETEVFSNKQDAVKFLYDTIDQVSGKLEMRNRSTRLEKQDNLILIHELCDIFVLTDDKWVFYAKARASTLMQQKKEGWKIIHQHSSFPDARTGEGENIAIDKIAEENRELREAVKRRTVELEQKNRELEIEAALEKVRAVAMSMNKPDDLLNICEILFKEFNSLGFTELRNAMINIHDDEKKSFLNYDYSEEIGKSINHLQYNIHPVIEKQIKQIRSANDAFSETVFTGKDLDSWKAFRKKIGEKDDPRINNSTALYYYFYSIGTGSIGISTFSSINEEKLELLKRFRNVFSLSYQRYSDIDLAEAQTREAQIQLGLERVRARAMAMQKSDELSELVDTVFKELTKLDFALTWCIINIIDESSLSNMVWAANPDIDKAPDSYLMKFEDYPFHDAMMKGYKERATKYIYVLEGLEKKVYDEYLFKETEFRKVPEEAQAASRAMEKYVCSFTFCNFGGLQTVGEEPLSDDNLDILARFGKVFDLTYTRFNDLQKAETQARESKIQLALERVRSSTMAMHHSDELKEVLSVTFEQLKSLNITIDSCVITLFIEGSDDLNTWVASAEQKYPQQVRIPYFKHPLFDKIALAKNKPGSYFTLKLSQKENRTFYKHILEHSDFGRIINEERRNLVMNAESNIMSFANFQHTGLRMGNFRNYTYTQEENNTILRFANVFEQTYTRFLDLQKAEAQAREAQIEAALERVRSRTMGMQKSDELLDVIQVIYEQLLHLNFNIDSAGFAMDYRDSDDWNLWMVDRNGPYPNILHIPYFDHPMANAIIDAKKNGLEILVISLTFEEKNKLWDQFFKYVSVPEEAKETLYSSPGFFMSKALFKNVDLFIQNYTGIPCSDAENATLIRFGKVFEQTYIRFNDLKQAEAQAREAQIEAALEKVRSRSMGMQKSEELKEVIQVVYDQFVHLNIKVEHTGFVIDYKARDDYNIWIADPLGVPSQVTVPYFDSVYYNRFNEAKEKGEDFFATNLSFEEKNKFYQKLFEYVPGLPEEAKEFYFSCPGLAGSTVLLDNVCLYIENFSGIPYTDEENNTLMRFGKVFQQTYTRFNDLKQAEAQAREAQIEAALERVRSKAMAMYNTNDLSKTVSAFFKELRSLNVLPWRCGVGQINEETKTTFLTTTSNTINGESFEVRGTLQQEGHPVLDGIFEYWKLQKEFYPVLQGDEIRKYYEIIRPQIAYPKYPLDAIQYGNFIFIKEGFVFAWTENKLSEGELGIFRRFASVLSLTYRRYLDLKEAEVRAFEAVREASLDRVRAEIASMRTAEDLNHITPIIWRELKTLEVPFIRCGVFIVDEELAKIQVYLSTPDGKSLGVLNLPIEFSALTSNSVEYWRMKKVYKEHWSKEQFIKWTKSMIEQGQVQNAQTYQGSSAPPESLNLHFVPFAQGMLYVGDISPLTEEKLQLVKSLAEGFSIAYARYEDFINLENAKNRVEITLSELKSAQAQLVHSEKMASLGELTAGIAHEIKNPLNFVNNFSELSRELLDDLKEELEKDNKEEVMAIVNDVKQNLEKINQHGKRADSIVKGMLLHSRGTSGDKALTDLNNLLDQYVTLAYHGLRAQNKEFNITIEKDYDETLEKISVVPQDISRVFLNIINNACYAANEKKQKSGNDFVPILKVSSKNLHGKVEIHIRDNGNGIPESIREKLFNPFFTTKPTGEGTGLGLSLSYDIVVKQHSGEIKFESEEGEYTEFIITLPKK